MTCSPSSAAPVIGIESLEARPSVKFTIGTIMSDQAQYEAMHESFVSKGFGASDCEFLFINNRGINRFDAYAGLRAILSNARGEYVILCHQDVRLLQDGRRELEDLLSELGANDPDWALAGNAGGTETGLAIRISDPHGEDTRLGQFPTRVQSLDENFIVVRRSAMIAPSNDLSGFHLYGTDLCLQATARGMTSYVVDFHLRHFGRGTIGKDYYECLEALERKYSDLFRPRRIITTCLHPLLTPSRLRLAVERLKRLKKKANKLRAEASGLMPRI